MNSTKYITPTLKSSLSKNIKTKGNEPFFKTIEISKRFPYDLKQIDLKTAYANNNMDIVTKNFEEKNETIRNTTESQSSINIKYKDEINYNTSSKNSIKFRNAFNLSYIPFNLMCINKDIVTKTNLPKSSNINDIINESKKMIDLNILKKSYSIMSEYNNESSNNNSLIKSYNKQNFTKEFKNKLNIIANKETLINNQNGKNFDKTMKIISKKSLISSIVKDFYKGIRLNGYSSFIHNKDMNTLYMRRYNKKYASAEKVSNNVKYHLLKIKDSFPIIV
jgi:hypothetical protein